MTIMVKNIWRARHSEWNIIDYKNSIESLWKIWLLVACVSFKIQINILDLRECITNKKQFPHLMFSSLWYAAALHI